MYSDCCSPDCAGHACPVKERQRRNHLDRSVRIFGCPLQVDHRLSSFFLGTSAVMAPTMDVIAKAATSSAPTTPTACIAEVCSEANACNSAVPEHEP